MSTPVLIAYGTRHGCFEGVADKIGAMLKREGIDVMQVNLAKRHKKRVASC
jgi:menaquinone-dependent protoporphyrinogen IX oxidase